MTLAEYQQETNKTNCYPADNMLDCLVMGLCSEAGEVAGKVKKYHRDETSHEALQQAMIGEIGDLLWYVSELSNYFEVGMEDIAAWNISKLRDRQARGTIKGSGDER